MNKQTLIALTIIALSTTACGETKTVAVTSIRPWKPISSSCQDTPETRKEIVAHNSVYSSLKSGKKTVYEDDCPKEEKPSS
jgi:hypothetical protein